MEDNTSFQRTDRCTSTPHILVGVDDSPQSSRAFDLALSLAKQRAWSLRLVSGYELLYSDFEAGDDILRDYSDAAKVEAQRPLKAMVEKTEAEGVPGTVAVNEGSPARLGVSSFPQPQPRKLAG